MTTKLFKFFRNWTNLVSIIGVILVFAIVLSGVDAMYLFVVLGAMNFLYGLYSIITKKNALKTGQQADGRGKEKYNCGICICQMIMGVFVLAMGIIYICEILPGKYFWDTVLAGVIILMICWYVIKIKSRKF